MRAGAGRGVALPLPICNGEAERLFPVASPLGELPERLDELDDWRKAEIVVYCHHGVRSLQGTSLLQRAGFERVFNLRGGIDRWSLDIDPTVPRY